MKEECKCYQKELMMVSAYFILLLINVLTIWLVSSLFPNDVVLGTWSISKPWAILHSMGILTLLDIFAIPFIRMYEAKKDKKLNPNQWMVVYFLINTAGVWLIARFANETGLGISSWIVALFLGLVFDLFQGLGLKWIGKMEIKKYI